MDVQADVNHSDIAQAVRESAILADVTISTWGAEMTDRKATDALKASAGAVGEVGRFVKNLLAGADGKLKDTKAAFSSVRALHYQLTLPWVSDPHAQRQTGARLLPHMLFQRYLQEISVKKREAMNVLDGFIADYPAMVSTAQSNLGSLADLKYPTPDEVRAHFRITMDFQPIPAGSSFKGLPDLAIERLSAGLHAKQMRMIESAQRAMWESVRERVGFLAERLRDPEARFKAGTVQNVRELITLLPGWNVVGSDNANEVARDIERMLAGVEADHLRDDPTKRTTVVNEAQAIVDKLNSWGV